MATDAPLVSLVVLTMPEREHFMNDLFHSLRELVLPYGAEWIVRMAPGDVGSKRQSAMLACRGEIVVMLDDDDWHHPMRVVKQVAELRKNPTGVVGTANFYVFDDRTKRTTYSRTWGGCTCMPAGSLAFWRDVGLKVGWEPGPGSEDQFLGKWPGPVVDMADPSLYVHRRHGGNVSPDSWVLNTIDVPPAELRATLGTFWENRPQ